MNRRASVGGLLVMVCLAILLGVWSQRSQLAGLRAEQQQLLAARADNTVSPRTAEAADASSGASPPALVATPELLRLRNDVTQLTERRRELAGARAENERLRAQIASRGTNGPAGFRFPPGYVRKSEARMLGYNTPDDTIQSFLWATQSRNFTNLLQALTPDSAEAIRDRVLKFNQSIEDFFRQTEAMPGMAILNRKQLPDGALELEVEVVPGAQSPPIRMRQVGGQWKIDQAF